MDLIRPPAVAPPGAPAPRDPADAAAAEPRPPARPSIRTERLSAFYGKRQAIRDVTLDVPARQVTAIIGPSGCGKSTLIRTFNRLHEVIPGASVRGRVLLEGEDISAPDVDAVALRRWVGMVFQKPNPLPTMSVYENVADGLRLTMRASRRDHKVHEGRTRRTA